MYLELHGRVEQQVLVHGTPCSTHCPVALIVVPSSISFQYELKIAKQLHLRPVELVVDDLEQQLETLDCVAASHIRLLVLARNFECYASLNLHWAHNL